jgi:hypothetical protein
VAQLKPALQTSKGRSKPWAGSRLVNAFAELSEGDKAELFAIQAIPGLTLFSDIGADNIRGMHRMGTVLYVVAGVTLYSVASDGTETSIGTIPGFNPVRMFDNGTELGIHNGHTSGYVYSAVGGLVQPVNLPGVTDGAYIDGYFVWTLDGGDQFIISGLDAGTSYDPLDVASVEGSPDPLAGVINDHRELLFFGSSISGSTPSTEIWVNTGNADFPFERQGNAFLERGTLDRDSIVKIDNGVHFVGDDRIIYRLDGYTPTRISTHAVEKGIAGASWFRAYTYTMEGHKFYVLNTDTGTWAFDMATGAWHERETRLANYHRVSHAVTAYGQTIFGDNSIGKLYTASLDVHDENGTAIPIIVELPPIGNGVDRKTLYALEVFGETGVGNSTIADPQIIMQYSRDGGRNWSNELWRSLGAIGRYETRAVWRVNVEFRQLQIRLTMPDKCRRMLIGYHADIR